MKELFNQDIYINNNKAYIKNINKPGMLLVWAEWCPHCINFKPVYKELSNRLTNKFPCMSIEEQQINGSVQRALNVSSYPSIYFFDKNGKVIDRYTGNRSQNDMLKHICNFYHQCVKYN
jgi:thioredoxin-like negative regulator of GroEL